MSETRREASTAPVASGSFLRRRRVQDPVLVAAADHRRRLDRAVHRDPRFDDTTVAAVAVLFGVYCLVAAVNQIMIGAVSSSTGWRIAHGLLAALLVVVGVVSLMNLDATSVTLAAIISFYFIFRGCFDVAFALAGSAVSGWWVLLIAGLIELGLGFWAAGSWNVSVVVLVAWVAAGALVHGIGEIALAFQIHHGRRGLTALEGLAHRLGVTNNHPAPDAAVPSPVTHRSRPASGHAQRRNVTDGGFCAHAAAIRWCVAATGRTVDYRAGNPGRCGRRPCRGAGHGHTRCAPPRVHRAGPDAAHRDRPCHRGQHNRFRSRDSTATRVNARWQ